MKRTLENCAIIKQMGVRPNQHNGVCEGFGKSETDDEPCRTCKKCKLLYTNQEEEEDER